MTALAAEEDSIISDIFLIAKAVKEHLKEPNCTHNIRFIVKQALDSKSGLRELTSPEPTQTGANNPKDQSGVAYTSG